MNASALASSRGLAGATTWLGFLLAGICIYFSEGFHQDDDLKHLQIARWSLEDPRYLLDTWGRPGFTVLYALPAQLGNFAARLFSAALAAGSAWLLYRVAVRMRCPAPAIVPVLLWTQPLFLALACTTLTETALVFYFCSALFLWQSERFHFGALCISLAILTRHEAAVFAVLWAIDCWRRRGAWTELGCLISAPLLHNLLAALFIGATPAALFVDATPTQLYGSGSWLTMTLHASAACGAGWLLLAGAGASTLARCKGGREVLACALIWWATHTIIYRFGLFASAGYPRFLVPLAPMVALAAAAAVGRSLAEWQANAPRLQPLRGFADGALLMTILQLNAFILSAPPWSAWADLQVGLAAGGAMAISLLLASFRRLAKYAWVLVLFALAMTGYEHWLLQHGQPRTNHAVPFEVNTEQRLVEAGLDWTRAQGWDQKRMIGFSWWLDELRGDVPPFAPPTPNQRIDALSAGDLVFWTCKHDPMEHPELSLEALEHRRDLREVYVGPHFEPLGVPFVRIFEKLD